MRSSRRSLGLSPLPLPPPLPGRRGHLRFFYELSFLLVSLKSFLHNASACTHLGMRPGEGVQAAGSVRDVLTLCWANVGRELPWPACHGPPRVGSACVGHLGAGCVICG